MSVETIIAILTAGAAFITSVLGIYFNVSQNRKDKIQKVILENRIKYMYEIRDGFTDFIGLANVGAIKAAKHSTEASKAFYAALFTGYGKLQSYIKPFYDIDLALLESLDDLYSHILSMANGETDDVEKLTTLRDDFYDKYTKYDWAYWKYIQKQKYGDYMNSDDAYDKVYEEFLQEIENRKNNSVKQPNAYKDKIDADIN